MNGIQNRRKEIDRIDAALLRLLNRRAQLAIEVGRLKRNAGLPLCLPARERDVLLRAAGANNGPLDDEAVEKLFRLIIRESRRIQERALASESMRAGAFPADAAKTHAQQASK